MSNLQERFGKLVAAHRKRRGWTQRQLAEAADLSDDMIARIEAAATGVSFTTVDKLALALNIDPAELFTSQVPNGALHRGQIGDLLAKLASLREDELVWLNGVIEAALKPRK